MRKADYALLARTIAKRLQYARSMQNGALTEARREYAAGYVLACERIAREFAGSASVDPAAFLRACGIE